MSGRTQILITGGRVVNDDQSFEADVYIVDEKIILVGPNLNVPAGAKIINANGKLIIPGGVDSSTRLQAPYMCTRSVDNFYHGSKAALAGGTTTIVDCVVPEQGQSLVEAYNKWREAADPAVCCDFALRVAVTWWGDKVASDMEVLSKEKGVNSFVLSLANEWTLDDTNLYQALKHCQRLGATAFIDTENRSFTAVKAKELIDEGIVGPEGHLLSRPEDVEASTVYRIITLANQANAPICISKVTGKMSADVIARSRRQGKVVFGESLVAALALDGSHYYNHCWHHAAAFVMNPPLRLAPDTSSSLINRLASGDLEFVASDHCTFNANQKAIGKDDFRFIPPGVNGVGERLSVAWDRAVVGGKMDPCRFVAITSTSAAKLFNIYPRKGRIAVGSDADIVIWDTDAQQTFSSKTHHSECDFNVYEGMTCRGVPAYVISAGHVVVDGDGLHVAEGNGQHLPLPCGSELAYGRIWAREKLERPQSVQRDAEDMPTLSKDVGSLNLTGSSNANKSTGGAEFYTRPPTRSGGRNMQESTFNLSGMSDSAQVDDPMRPTKKGCGTRINQPPGGKTTQLW